MILTEKSQEQIDEYKLWEQYNFTKDICIRNQIIEKYSYLVKIIALKLRGIYQQYGDVEDIVNEGIIALIDVIDKFDLSKNIKFETYATIRIRGSIIDYVRKQDWIPRKVKNDYKSVKEAQDHLTFKLGREPEDKEIATYLELDIKDYNNIIRNAHGTSILSFEELLSEANLREIETSNGYELPEHELEAKELNKILKENINKLNEKEKLVVSLYYKEELKLKDIAKILNISNSRVSQIHTSALQKLEQGINKYLYDSIEK
ncbi:MAG: FliA/WhiG family RNA polymerase sigma factor [Sedimentibacter sp.]|uniref:sigma-70 family RNA polymerase sigma factor n=1 Tax=Sedimentibacter sp. TaxID=1960295 RepID=UPI0029826C12|nr:FliA/WhiG family RNA polymerase sigma factor [Sedimentibacter sp.]MDW5300017.1 FliA/WhiG family RNA polymerase sigma factor [Sedimentibacter sp.]